MRLATCCQLAIAVALAIGVGSSAGCAGPRVLASRFAGQTDREASAAAFEQTPGLAGFQTRYPAESGPVSAPVAPAAYNAPAKSLSRCGFG